MNDTIKIIKSLEVLAVLLDGVTETVKDEVNKQEDRCFGALLGTLSASLVQRAIFSVVKGIRGRGFR